MFRIACGLRERRGWEIAPSEFWRMTPQEWWWLYEINVGEGIRAEQDTRDRLKRLYRQSKEAEQ